VSTAGDGRPGVAEELRRRRTALGWTLEQVAAQAQVSVGMLSLIETGKRRPFAADACWTCQPLESPDSVSCRVTVVRS
jgi:transcriptional regulator with XRE-family HTH domain